MVPRTCAELFTTPPPPVDAAAGGLEAFIRPTVSLDPRPFYLDRPSLKGGKGEVRKNSGQGLRAVSSKPLELSLEDLPVNTDYRATRMAESLLLLLHLHLG